MEPLVPLDHSNSYSLSSAGLIIDHEGRENSLHLSFHQTRTSCPQLQQQYAQLEALGRVH